MEIVEISTRRKVLYIIMLIITFVMFAIGIVDSSNGDITVGVMIAAPVIGLVGIEGMWLPLKRWLNRDRTTKRRGFFSFLFMDEMFIFLTFKENFGKSMLELFFGFVFTAILLIVPILMPAHLLVLVVALILSIFYWFWILLTRPMGFIAAAGLVFELLDGFA